MNNNNEQTTTYSESSGISMKSEILKFQDSEVSWVTEVKSNVDTTYKQGMSTDDELGSFFSRPVLIGSYAWGVGTSLDHKLNPWEEFFVNNPHVFNRIQNYNLLRAKLHIKVVINGNSFYAGRSLVSYEPLHQFKSVVAQPGTSDILNVIYSQRPHITLDPTTSEGGELMLPFFWHKNWLSIPDNDFSYVGELSITSLAPLEHYNGGTDAVTVTVYAFATDVELHVPTTVEYVPQSEYENPGAVSKAASAIARVAGSLVKAPIIGPYAKATEMAAGATASIARIFGYARPPVLCPPEARRINYAGELAVTDQAENVAKLALDSKQELTVDSRTVGLDGEDDMAIENIYSRESYLTSFPWDPSKAPSTLLWNSLVTPNQIRVENEPSGKKVTYTPSAHVAQLFDYWQGTMTFRFVVVASAFHRGRLRIVVDPNYYKSATPATSNVVYTHIVDISKQREFTLDVNWMQPEPMATIQSAQTANEAFSLVEAGAGDPGANGLIRVEVLNELTSPSSSGTAVTVLVFTKGKSLRFVAPTSTHIAEATPFEAQSEFIMQAGEVENTNAPVATETEQVGTSYMPSEISTIFGGEEIVSIRQLMKRYWFLSMRVNTNDSVPAVIGQRILNYYPDYPAMRGQDPSSYQINTAGEPYNYVNMTTMGFFQLSFVGYRGGIRYKYLDSAAERGGSIEAARYPQAITAFATNITVPLTAPEQSLAISQYSGSGAYVTPTTQQPVAEIELPFYSPYRFAFARNVNYLRIIDDKSNVMNHVVSTLEHTGEFNIPDFIAQYVAIGEDFSFFWYLNSPTFYYQTTPP